MVAQLSEQEKTNIFKEDTKKSIAILLHEFAEPNGTSHRFFDTSDAISKSLIKSPGFKLTMRRFLNNDMLEDSATQLKSITNFRYVMTPRKGYESGSFLRQFSFAGKEHLRLAFKPNLAQFFLGSYLFSANELDSIWTKVEVYNETSRNSLFLHLPPSVEKPNVFGTVKQSFTLYLRTAQFK